MSYADVAAHNAPPSSQQVCSSVSRIQWPRLNEPSRQPHPDPALLNTEPPTADNIVNDAKVNIVAPDFKARLDAASEEHSAASGAKRPSSAKDRARKYVHDAEEEGIQLWTAAKQLLFRPAVAGGLIGLRELFASLTFSVLNIVNAVNIGLISGVGYTFYACPHLRRNSKIITSTAAAALAIFTGEGYLAEVYRKTPAGREEERRAKQEGAALYRYSREHLLRPGVLGGIVGAGESSCDSDDQAH